MNKTVFLFLALSIVLSLLISCSFYPSVEEWYISQVGFDDIFSNSQTQYKRIYSEFGPKSPWAVHQDMTYIEFGSHGKVVFMPYDSNDELVGEYKHNLNGELFITFENGEQIDNGSARFSYSIANTVTSKYQGSVMFEFKGIQYKFTTDGELSMTSDEYEDAVVSFAEAIRSNNYDLQSGTVSNGVLSSDSQGNIRNLFEEGWERVTAVKIYSDNRLEILDYIPEGECYFYSDGIHYVIYYISQ